MTGAEFVGYIGFRLRLLRLALRPLDRIPAAVVMALEEPGYDIDLLLPASRVAEGR